MIKIIKSIFKVNVIGNTIVNFKKNLIFSFLHFYFLYRYVGNIINMFLKYLRIIHIIYLINVIVINISKPIFIPTYNDYYNVDFGFLYWPYLYIIRFLLDIYKYNFIS